MSDPETGPGIPEQEKFSSRQEEKEFSAIHFDPNVRRAIDEMELHADVLEGEPASPIEHLLEELKAERAKPSPDPTKLEDIRIRMKQEHVLVAAQTVTPEKEARHQRDMQESEFMNERENVVNNITKTRLIIEGLEKDIREIADETIGDMAEEYPDPIADILDNVADIRVDVFDNVREVLEEPDPDAEGMIPISLLDEKILLATRGQLLMKTYGLLLKARDEMIDQQSEMLKAVTEWRQKHQAS